MMRWGKSFYFRPFSSSPSSQVCLLFLGVDDVFVRGRIFLRSRIFNLILFWGYWKKIACYVVNLNVTEKGEIMNPNSIDKNLQVKGLRIDKQIVHFVPKFTDLFAHRLEDFRVHSCHLKEVSKEDFVGKKWVGGSMATFSNSIRDSRKFGSTATKDWSLSEQTCLTRWQNFGKQISDLPVASILMFLSKTMWKSWERS